MLYVKNYWNSIIIVLMLEICDNLFFTWWLEAKMPFPTVKSLTNIVFFAWISHYVPNQ